MKFKRYLNHPISIYGILLLLCIAVLFQSPLIPGAAYMIQNDSSIFITIARNILDGDILYKEIADHKGPMIFIMDAIGLLLTNGKLIGIWLLDVFSLFITSIIMYKTACLLTKELVALAVTILSIVFIVPIIGGGNLTELWSLPYISIAFYIFIQYLTGKKEYLSYGRLFVLSFTFVIAFLFKATYVAAWCAFGLIIIIKQIHEKKWKELGKYLMCVFGFSCLTLLPFFLYFYYHDALQDAYFWMIGYNLQYSYEDTTISIIKRTFLIIIGVWHLPFIVILSILLQIIRGDYKEHKYLFYGYILAIICTAYTCALGLKADHYNIIFAPLLILPYAYLANCMKLKSFMQQFALLLMVSGSGYLLLIKQMDNRNFNHFYFGKDARYYKRVADIIREHTSPDDVIIGTIEAERNIYVYANRKCGNYSLSNVYYYDVDEEILNKRPKVFFTEGFFNHSKLKKYYELVEEYGKTQIWVRKELCN